jgi:hypothetical protein
MKRPEVVLTGCLLALGLSIGCVQAQTQTMVLPKGTGVQKLGSGHFRFLLPNGQTVEGKNVNGRTGIIGDCGVHDQTGKLIATGQCVLRGALAPGKEAAAKMPPTEYVKIDDEVTWLPAMLTVQTSAASGMGQPMMSPVGPRLINPQPEPPKQMHKLGDPDPPPGAKPGQMPGMGVVKPLSPQPDPPGSARDLLKQK